MKKYSKQLRNKIKRNTKNNKTKNNKKRNRYTKKRIQSGGIYQYLESLKNASEVIKPIKIVDRLTTTSKSRLQNLNENIYFYKTIDRETFDDYTNVLQDSIEHGNFLMTNKIYRKIMTNVLYSYSPDKTQDAIDENPYDFAKTQIGDMVKIRIINSTKNPINSNYDGLEIQVTYVFKTPRPLKTKQNNYEPITTNSTSFIIGKRTKQMRNKKGEIVEIKVIYDLKRMDLNNFLASFGFDTYNITSSNQPRVFTSYDNKTVIKIISIKNTGKNNYVVTYSISNINTDTNTIKNTMTESKTLDTLRTLLFNGNFMDTTPPPTTIISQ